MRLYEYVEYPISLFRLEDIVPADYTKQVVLNSHGHVFLLTDLSLLRLVRA